MSARSKSARSTAWIIFARNQLTDPGVVAAATLPRITEMGDSFREARVAPPRFPPSGRMRRSGSKRRCRACGTWPHVLHRVHGPLRRHHLCQRISAVPGSTDHGQADPAVVRRVGQRLDHVPCFLSGDSPARLCLRRPGGAPDVAANAGSSPCPIAGAELYRLADRARRTMENARNRKSIAADPFLAHGDDSPALFSAVDDESAGAGVVLAQLSGQESLPLIRALEPGVDARATRLS